MLNRLDEPTMRLIRLDHFNLVSRLALELVDLNNTTQTFSLMHRVHQIINFVETIELVGHKLAEWQLTKQHLIDELGHILAGLPASESSTFPNASSDKLERSCGDFLPSSGDSNNS